MVHLVAAEPIAVPARSPLPYQRLKERAHYDDDHTPCGTYAHES
jgi:hypothetical protein